MPIALRPAQLARRAAATSRGTASLTRRTFKAQAFAAATFGAEFTGPLPEVPGPELPPLPEELPPSVEVEGALGAAASLLLAPSVFAAGFESPPSDGLDLFEE
jgi:hypothetical protein